MKRKLSKSKIWDYFILTARFLLAWTFIRYGYSKLVGGQFGITEADMETALNNLSLFKISWYLFDHEPFRTFIGISQIICGFLLLINRTTIIGAFLFLPIVSTILIMDLTFMPPSFANAFAWRLTFYILLDLLILWHYREKMKIIWNAVWINISTKYRFPFWAYLLLPLFALGLEITGLIPRTLAELIIHPTETINSFMKIPALLTKILNGIA